jgi:hypothetical protein
LLQKGFFLRGYFLADKVFSAQALLEPSPGRIKLIFLKRFFPVHCTNHQGNTGNPEQAEEGFHIFHGLGFVPP